MLANELSLGGQPMESWFDRDPTISGTADADMEGAKHLASHRSPGDTEVPPAASGATAISIQLPGRLEPTRKFGRRLRGRGDRRPR